MPLSDKERFDLVYETLIDAIDPSDRCLGCYKFQHRVGQSALSIATTDEKGLLTLHSKQIKTDLVKCPGIKGCIMEEISKPR